MVRGVAELAYELKPSMGRYLKWQQRLPELQRDSMRLFRIFGTPHCGQVPATEWEWLALAQHHGLPTALLDWSRSVLVAAYFAVEKEPEKDGAVYAYEGVDFLEEECPPSKCTDVRFVLPPHVSPRMTAQSGVFSFHPNPTEALDGSHVHKIRIPAAVKPAAMELLENYGIHASSLFPGLDGIARHIRQLKSM